MKNEKISKDKGDNSQVKNSKNKITNKHLTNLDNFIQQCLDKFKFIEPKQEFYDVTGNEKDLIISHKSTIPDLVIWNKKFDKNECFEEGNNSKKANLFPRFQFYLRIKSNKPDKDKKKEKKNEKEKNKKNKEGKKNKKKQENKNNNANNNINTNNNTINNSNVNINNNIKANNNVDNSINSNTNYNSKSEKKILDLSELDINKIKEFNPRHKNNFFSSNKEIMNLNDKNPLNDNKYNNGGKNKNLKEIGINGEISSKDKIKSNFRQQKDYYNMPNKIGTNNNFNSFCNSNETQGNSDINITINNNNYIQQYQLNNNNNINRFININNDLIFKDNNNFNFSMENTYLDNKMKEKQLINLINLNNKKKGWLVLETSNGNIIGIYSSLELYLYLSKNSLNIINYTIKETSSQFLLAGDKMFKILSQYYDYNINNNLFQYNQLEKMKQQIKQNNLKNMNKRNMNVNQMNLNINNNFNDNPLNNNTNNFNANDNNLKINNNPEYNDNMKNLNYAMQNMNLMDYNKLNNNNNNRGLENINNMFNIQANNDNINSNNNSNNNIVPNNNLNSNKSNNNIENDLFSPESFFSPKGIFIQNQSQNQEVNQKNLSQKDKNLDTFSSSNNINSPNNNSSNFNFNYFIMDDNNLKEKENEKNIIEMDDKIDGDDYNFENFIFNSNSNTKNSNSKSNMDNVDDNNMDDFGQFEPNFDCQNDDYNSIFSQFSNDKN